MSTEIETPELDRMAAVREHSQAIGEFLEWLASVKRWRLAAYVTELEYEPGERFYVDTHRSRYGGPRYRIVDRAGLFGHYVGRWFDDREDAERDMAKREAERLEQARRPENRVLRVQHYAMEELLAEYFGIDLDKIERERRALLEALRQEDARPDVGTP